MCVATLALVGAGISAAGAVSGGIAAGHAASYQAQVARNNATIEQQNAAYSASAGAAQAEQSGLAERSKLANLRAGEAANGLDVNSGSPAEVQESERLVGRLNTETVSNNAALQAYGYESKATSEQAQAKLDSAEAGWDPIAGGISAAGTLLSNPTVDAAGAKLGSSLLSGAPSVPSDYQWMQANSFSEPEPQTYGGFSL